MNTDKDVESMKTKITIAMFAILIGMIPTAFAQTTTDNKTGLTTYTDPNTGLVYDIPIVGYYCIDFNEDNPCFVNGKMIVNQENGTSDEQTEGEDAVERTETERETTTTYQAVPETDETVGETDSIEKEDESDSEYCDDNDNDGYCDDDPSICIDNDENDVCDVDEVPTMPDTSPTNDWMNACSTIQQFLYQSCDAYVNSDGTLTDEGDSAVVCIRNGAVLAGGGVIGGVPPSIAADILGGLAEMTGCGGIVDMEKVKQMVSLGGLTDLSSLSKFLP